ncbi:hypothetical protein [Paraburkholderia sp. J11-2]|uniref:hypothetical protein n=1 Tax=Paraburkholderia sp. J11-2 TaxID=2805431 RepID=UPI002AB5E852|nr:hypothetical protein [Paraburkholderia sp. J11-2]
MSTFTYTAKILGLFPVKRTVVKPRIYYSTGGIVPCWVCSNGGGYPGFGKTPRQAWNDWANWSLV